MTAVYVYGVVPADAKISLGEGVGGREVDLEPFDGIAALVSVIDEASVRPRKADLVRHSDVLQEAVAATTVLPLRFGTAFPGRDSLRNDFLVPRHDELARLLDEFTGMVELDVKAVYADEDAVLAELVAQNPSIGRLREASRSLPEDASYFERIRLGELVAAAFEERRAADAAAITAALAPLAAATHFDDRLPRGGVLNAAFLVDRAGVDAFDAAAESAAAEWADRITVKLVGPLPPYSFAALTHDAAAGRTYDG